MVALGRIIAVIAGCACAADQNLVQLATAKGLTTLVGAITEAELTEQLEDDQQYTLLAPTNDAFTAVPDVVTFLMKPENKGQLVKVLKSHILSGRVTIDDVTNGQEITTLGGSKLTIGIDGDVVTIGEATVTAISNQVAINGVMHVIDAVLMPNLVDLADAEGLTTLVDAITKAELTKQLSGDKFYTLVAPNNEAFTKAGNAVTDLMKPENKGQLVKVLKYHVLSGRVTSDDVTNGQEITTLEGNNLKIGIDGDIFTVGGATVTAVSNKVAINGVMHVIDKVLMPPEGTTGKSTVPATANDTTEAGFAYGTTTTLVGVVVSMFFLI